MLYVYIDMWSYHISLIYKYSGKYYKIKMFDIFKKYYYFSKPNSQFYQLSLSKLFKPSVWQDLRKYLYFMNHQIRWIRKNQVYWRSF